MSQYSLEGFGAYQKDRQLFDLVVSDMAALQKDSRCYRLIAQQVASADSICSNIEEGHGRLSRSEYIRFLDFARGSARETRGRYERLKTWLAPEVIHHRVVLTDEIIAILTKTIQTLRSTLQTNAGSTSCLKDEPLSPCAPDDFPPSSLDPRPFPLP